MSANAARGAADASKSVLPDINKERFVREASEPPPPPPAAAAEAEPDAEMAYSRETGEISAPVAGLQESGEKKEEERAEGDEEEAGGEEVECSIMVLVAVLVAVAEAAAEQIAIATVRQEQEQQEQEDMESSCAGQEESKGLICGHVVWAQYIAAWNMPVEDAHNQGTLVLFNVGSDISMRELREVFERFGECRHILHTHSQTYIYTCISFSFCTECRIKP